MSDSTTNQVFRTLVSGIGNAGDLPVIGDWDGDGYDTLGLYRLRNHAGSQYFGTIPGQPDSAVPVPFGDPGDVPVVGDFDGDGDTDLGVFRLSQQRFFLDPGVKAVRSTPTPAPSSTPAPMPAPAPTLAPGSVPGGSAPNGSGGNPASGSFVARSSPKRLLVGFGRPVRVRGKLVDVNGQPISGASVDVFERIAIGSAVSSRVGTLSTDENGAFTYRATAASSRVIEFAFAERAGLTTYRSRLAVELRVKAKISLRSNRATARRGHVVKYRGRVRVGDFPKRGARVVLEANSGAGWKLGAVVRTTAAGSFTWNHAYRTRGRFRVRARLLTSVDLPARPATSAPQLLEVR